MLNNDNQNSIISRSALNKKPLLTKTITSRELFKESKTIIIKHVGEEYRLSITSKDKLILTK